MLQSVVDIFSRGKKANHDPHASPGNHKKKHPIHEPVSPLSTAARVQKKKAKQSARKLKAVEHKAGQEKRASEARAADKKKGNSKAAAKAHAQKKKAKGKAAKKNGGK